jgi:Flp pilus assembly protein TadD
MGRVSNKLYVLLICVVLVLATAGVYWQVREYEFVGFDDRDYVGENVRVLNGLTREGFAWAFTTTKTTGNWHPLTWLSLMLDCELFESKSQACHTTNILFHLANTLLLFVVLRRMSGALWRSAFVAGLFALHPLHVESVAWVSERKDVLSTFFWLLTMWAYVRYVERVGAARYVPIVVFFALGLMAKPMLVTLPFVLLLLDYWPLGRLRLNKLGDKALANSNAGASGVRKAAARLVAEKVPLFILTVISCVVTYLAQQSRGAVQPIESMRLNVRLANAVVSYSDYIVKTIWPSRLAVFYPYQGMAPIWQIAQAGLVLVGVSAMVMWWVRRRPYLAVGWLWYVGTLVPVIGLVQVGAQSMADRYTYVPLVGLFIAVTWGIADLADSWRYRRIVLGVSAAAVLLVLMVCTWRQVGYWRNSITLFEHTLAVTSNNALAHNNLGFVLAKRGELDKAIEHHREALRLNPGDASVHINLGMELELKHEYAEAIKHYEEALRINPDQAVAHNNLGTAILNMYGELEEAAEQFREALRLRRDYDSARLNLATVLVAQGKIDEAIWHYEEVLRLNPNDNRARLGLKAALTKRDKSDEQKEGYERRRFKVVLP